MTVRFIYEGPPRGLVDRELLGHTLGERERAELKQCQATLAASRHDWTIILDSILLFDASGLELIKESLSAYKGSASELRFELELSSDLRREYYSLQPEVCWNEGRLQLPLKAVRSSVSGGSIETRTIALPCTQHTLSLPASMGGPLSLSVPHALLIPYHGDFDLLFANQMGALSFLRRQVKRSPMSWFRAGVQFASNIPTNERIALSFRNIHPGARIHPTAVVEGSVIEEGAEIGAHCSVRYSIISAGARLFDGAKVEFSVVGARSWLMHDLVLYRSCTEADTFLIHGPYQFSYFQKRSAAFATIMMDFRADQAPIKVKTPAGLMAYQGRFLGSILGEDSRTLGGCLIAPGRIVPSGTWLGPHPSDVHTLQHEAMPTRVPIAPSFNKRRIDEPIIH